MEGTDGSFLLPSTAGGWQILGFDFDKLHFLSEEGDSILCPTSEVRKNRRHKRRGSYVQCSYDFCVTHEEARTYSTRTIFVCLSLSYFGSYTVCPYQQISAPFLQSFMPNNFVYEIRLTLEFLNAEFSKYIM